MLPTSLIYTISVNYPTPPLVPTTPSGVYCPTAALITPAGINYGPVRPNYISISTNYPLALIIISVSYPTGINYQVLSAPLVLVPPLLRSPLIPPAMSASTSPAAPHYPVNYPPLISAHQGRRPWTRRAAAAKATAPHRMGTRGGWVGGTGGRGQLGGWLLPTGPLKAHQTPPPKPSKSSLDPSEPPRFPPGPP